ncbi:MAG: formate dehydrogenase accessory sulfurtransferase FdhD [Acidobacteria bacterium]|nr:formate dehydrogenase accessory sulfurtransferase FdhD [Acidobacteriota bacterium]
MSEAASGRNIDRKIVEISRFEGRETFESAADTLAVEEPLEIRIGCGKEHRAVSITMRTPGADTELAVGFLFTEGIVRNRASVVAVRHCGKFPNNRNTIKVELGSFEGLDLKKLERNFYTTSSCGVCGKASLEALATAGIARIADDGFKVSAEMINALPSRLRLAQHVFGETGGLHAAALFDEGGKLIDLKEDVGRHNAVDKLIGAAFLVEKLPLVESVLFLSGRASFELIQKAAAAGVPLVCAVGAPSSLAVEAATEFGITLAGFVRDGRFNVYSNPQRLEI